MSLMEESCWGIRAVAAKMTCSSTIILTVESVSVDVNWCAALSFQLV